MANKSIGLNKVNEIILLTKNEYNRPDIAKKLGISTKTVWKYQKKFNLV